MGAGRIFIAAKSGAGEDRFSQGTTTRQIILLRDLIVQVLRSRDYEPISVPDELGTEQTIEWINRRAYSGDVALELQTDQDLLKPGAVILYIADNDQRRIQAEQLLQAYLRRVPQLVSQGAKPDTYSDLGSLAFCRNVRVPSLQMQVGRLTNLEDQWVIPAQPQDVALGVAEGLAGWSQAMASATSQTATPPKLPISILLNGALYEEEGILVDGNACVPIDLVDQLGLDGSRLDRALLIDYRNLVYLRAIDLQSFNLAVQWDRDTQTLSLRSALLFSEASERIMGRGTTSEVQLIMFLKSWNPEGLTHFAELPKLYREEASIEGVNHDIAFAQMCVETRFLRFGGLVKPEQNNFARLGGVSSDAAGEAFLDPRIGVRAQIQHLKAYASTEPLVQQSVDRRFHLVRRGVAPTVAGLSRRWSADAAYHTKIMAIVRRLYESAGLL